MSDYSEYFLSSRASVVQLELFEMSHTNFTQTYYIVRNAVGGITVTLEDDSEQEFIYYPVKIQNNGSKQDLDQSFTITFGDLGEIVPMELDEIASNNGFGTKPTLRYWIYRSDVLTAPLLGPLSFEIENFSFNREGCTFVAKAPSLNILKTGEFYDLERFPGLRGFL